jgi:Tol biopolymer transport system component
VLETNDGRGIDVPTPAVWSPDGRRFAFSTGKESPDDPGLAVADADSGEVVPLLADEFPVGWSPDGSELAFVQVGFNTRDVLSLVNASGTIRSFDTTLPEISGGAWSPDGTKIVVATGQASLFRGARSLELVDPAGGRPRVLTHFPRGSFVTVLAWRPRTPAH